MKYVLLSTFSIITFFSIVAQEQPIITPTITTLFGNFAITEPVLQELLECPTMQRLKNIHQYGMRYYAGCTQPYSRYEHSIGVLALLRRYGANLEEQIAGLLHDASHTVFSHIAEFLFKHKSLVTSYQDDIHHWLLEQTEVPAILAKHNISFDEIINKKCLYKCLEQDLPYLCADRIEYNIHGGFLENYITKEEIDTLLDTLFFEHGQWFFTDPVQAEKLGRISLALTENVFAAPFDWLINHWGAQALQRALDIHIITLNDIHFSTDAIIWERLQLSNDVELQQLRATIATCKNNFVITNATAHYDYCIHPKFRGVDPLVKTNKGLQPLTHLNTAYAHDYYALKNTLAEGIYITLQ